MTGVKITEMAAKLLGYTTSNGNLQLSERIMSKALVCVNLIYSDLWSICKNEEFNPLASLGDAIDLPDRVLYDVMSYGVAMMIAQSESDGDNQQLYAGLYNKKRSSLSFTETIEDRFPRSVDL